MLRTRWGFVAALAIAASIVMAIRDLHGFASPDRVALLTYGFNDRLRAVDRLIMLAVASLVAWQRYDRKLSRILAVALIGLSLNNNWWFYGPNDAGIRPSAALNYLGIAIGLTDFLRFAALYGTADWHGVRARIATFAPFLGAAILGFGTAWWVMVLTDPFDVAHYAWLNVAFWLCWDAVNALAIIAALAGAFTAPAPERRSMIWVAASFGIAALGTAVHGVDRLFQGDTVWANTVDALTLLALPLGLAFVIARHRLLDVELVVPRAILYSTLAVALYFLFPVIEVGLEHWTKDVPWLRWVDELPTGAFSLSLAVVLSVKRLESFGDKTLHRVFYAKIDDAIEALERFRSRLATRYSNAGELQDDLVRTLAFHGGGDAGLYHRGEEQYACVGAVGEYPASVPTHDPAVARLETADGPCVMPADSTVPYGVGLAMLARALLRGFAVCRAAGSLDERLQRALYETVVAAGVALELLRLEELERHASQLDRSGVQHGAAETTP